MLYRVIISRKNKEEFYILKFDPLLKSNYALGFSGGISGRKLIRLIYAGFSADFYTD